MDSEIFDIITNCDLKHIDDVFFTTREDAENWKKKHLTDPPYPLEEYTEWVSPDLYYPKHHGYELTVYVKF